MLHVCSRSSFVQRTREVKFRAFFYHSASYLQISSQPDTYKRISEIFIQISDMLRIWIKMPECSPFRRTKLYPILRCYLLYLCICVCLLFVYVNVWCVYLWHYKQNICGHENRLEQRQRLNLGQFISLLLITSASWVYSRRTTSFCCDPTKPTNMAMSTTTIVIDIK